MKVFHDLRRIILKSINWFLHEPKRLIRVIVLSICSVIVVFQMWECVSKLLHPPISTHSDFKINETMYYPAVTFCRNPPFKIDVLKKFNLSFHPSITSAWLNFSFHDLGLKEIYEQSTFSDEEIFGPYALNGYRENVELSSTMHFNGRCHTLKPKISTDNPWKESGYVITVKHDFVGIGDANDKGIVQGWAVYLHEPKEVFTEFGIASSGRVENLFLGVQEEIELKVDVHHFKQFRGRGQKCSDDLSKSTTACRENCIWDEIEKEIQCSGPWMLNRKTNYCNNYDNIRRMIVAYRNITEINDDTNCKCSKPCETTIYSSFVMNRKSMKQENEPCSKIYIYYTSKKVSILEERASYDSSQFLADLGGSLGFLLGLSVIGFIILLEKFLGYLFLDKLAENYKHKKEKSVKDENVCNSVI